MGDNAPPTPEVADNSAEATADADAEEDARQQINRP